MLFLCCLVNLMECVSPLSSYHMGRKIEKKINFATKNYQNFYLGLLKEDYTDDKYFHIMHKSNY